MDRIKPTLEKKSEKLPPLDRLKEVAQEHYDFEPGTKKAVDSGEITMEELIIYEYLYAYLNQKNIKKAKSIEDPIFFQACQKVGKVFNLDVDKIKETFKKVISKECLWECGIISFGQFLS